MCNAFSTRVVSPSSLDDETIDSWLSLEMRALEPNAFLSPSFVIAALKHLTPKAEVQIITIWLDEAERPAELVGVGVFELRSGSRAIPFRHLVAYQSVHSYLTGILVDKEYAREVVSEFFCYFLDSRAKWHGVAFTDWRSETEQGRLMLQVSAEMRVHWRERYRFQRAVLLPPKKIERQHNKSQKDLERRIRRLRDLGLVENRLIAADVTRGTIDKFLDLENRSWAKNAGTSLVQANHADFFREICEKFKLQSRLFFVETHFNFEPIASACYFVSGDQGFAFKIGWDDSFRKYSPGQFNEFWFSDNAKDLCGHLVLIDSGSAQGGFIEKHWDQRAVLASGIFLTSLYGRLLFGTVMAFRKVKQSLNRVRSGGS